MIPARIPLITMLLHKLAAAPGSRRARKRVARGSSAGGGTTAGRGTKGQQARTGKGRRFGFEGGQTPLLRRQPKLGGFRSPARTEYEVLNIQTLEQSLESGTYDIAALRAHKLVRSKKPVKILGQGILTKKLNLTVHAASESANTAVTKAGGSLTFLPRS
jgi:large subunit ribosomal protein L15